MVMIAVNLGQIAIYRTDVSNAADAGALAGASIISAQLLSYGLTSDYMCGNNLIKVAAIILAIIFIEFPWNLVTAISILTTIMSTNMTTLMRAFADSQMGWTRARKTALQYAFMNAGVDESKPTYEEFLEAIGEDPTSDNYDEYLKVDTERARNYLRTGFDKFMESSKNGYWITNQFGDVNDPSAPTPTPIVVNGYGWQRDDVTGEIVNSFEDNGDNQEVCYNTSCWRNYDNFVEVSVKSRLLDTFELVRLPGIEILGWAAFAYVFASRYIWWLIKFAWAGPLAPLLAAIFAAVEATLAKVLIESISFGLEFPGDDAEYVENSTLDVTVRRYRSAHNVGLWNFRYSAGPASPIQAFASGHCYKSSNETIGPTFLSGELWPFVLGVVVGGVAGGVVAYLIANWDDLFDTSRHLFDSKLRETE
jgi:hypothetical protein